MSNRIDKLSHFFNTERLENIQRQLITEIRPILVNWFKKNLILAISFTTAILTVVTYLMLLAYTSKYSIPFPHVFLPYLTMFFVVIACTVSFLAVFIAIFSILPIIPKLLFTDEEYKRILEVGAQGGLLSWRRCPERVRQFANLCAPAVVLEFVTIALIIFEMKTILTVLVPMVMFAIIFAIQIYDFKEYVRENCTLESSSEKVSIWLSTIIYSFIASFLYILWYINVILFIFTVPVVADYKGSRYESIAVLAVIIIIFLSQLLLFWLGLIRDFLGIFVASLLGAICIIFFYWGPVAFMESALNAHNLGGGIIATLSVKGNACQHLDDLVEEMSGAQSEAVCTTKPVAVLLDAGGTIYVKEPSNATAAEADGEKAAGSEKDNQEKNDREAVWSVDRNSVIGIEVQSRGRSMWLALPTWRS